MSNEDEYQRIDDENKAFMRMLAKVDPDQQTFIRDPFPVKVHIYLRGGLWRVRDMGISEHREYPELGWMDHVVPYFAQACAYAAEHWRINRTLVDQGIDNG